MLLQNGSRRTLDLVDIEEGEPSTLESVGLRVERANGNHLTHKIIVDRNLNEVSGTVFDVSHDRRV